MSKDCGKAYCLTCQEVFPVLPEKQVCIAWELCYHSQLNRLRMYAETNHPKAAQGSSKQQDGAGPVSSD